MQQQVGPLGRQLLRELFTYATAGAGEQHEFPFKVHGVGSLFAVC